MWMVAHIAWIPMIPKVQTAYSGVILVRLAAVAAEQLLC
jgi:hypothetical protein